MTITFQVTDIPQVTQLQQDFDQTEQQNVKLCLQYHSERINNNIKNKGKVYTRTKWPMLPGLLIVVIR